MYQYLWSSMIFYESHRDEGEDISWQSKATCTNLVHVLFLFIPNKKWKNKCQKSTFQYFITHAWSNMIHPLALVKQYTNPNMIYSILLH